jgi:hypothetical protein
LITTQFKPERYILALNNSLSSNNIGENELYKINYEIWKVIKHKKQPNWKSIFHSIQDKTELLAQVIGLGNTIIKFFQ